MDEHHGQEGVDCKNGFITGHEKASFFADDPEKETTCGPVSTGHALMQMKEQTVNKGTQTTRPDIHRTHTHRRAGQTHLQNREDVRDGIQSESPRAHGTHSFTLKPSQSCVALSLSSEVGLMEPV